MSIDTNGEQHLAFLDSLDRVRDIRFQHQRFAIAEPMFRVTCLDGQLSPKAVNHHVARRSMLRQAATWLECEQE